ncbi:MAG: hypothetical protein RLZZ627_199 [Pseudomonadota bacterium]|jgi:hypothetical protein
MNKKDTRFFGLMALLLAGSVSTALAHNTGGYLGTSPYAVDQFVIACTGGNSSTRMVTAIQDFLPINGPILSITVEKDGAIVTSVEVKNRDGKYSPSVELAGGEGAYVFTIQKAKGNAAALKRKMVYDAQYHCMTGDVHTETSDPLFLQNG